MNYALAYFFSVSAIFDTQAGFSLYISCNIRSRIKVMNGRFAILITGREYIWLFIHVYLYINRQALTQRLVIRTITISIIITWLGIV